MSKENIKRIAVFDSNPDECSATARAVREYYGTDQVLVEEFTDMQGFVEVFKQRSHREEGYHAVFLGVDGMLGVEAGRNIREIDRRFPLFCVSHTWDYGLESYRLHALNYLIKPVQSQNIGEAEGRINWNIISNERFRRRVDDSRISANPIAAMP